MTLPGSSAARRRCDVLVIGSGAAGLRAAIALDELGANVIVVGKRPRDDAHTVLAAGGINAALGTLDPEDSWVIHAADTLHEGRYLGDPRAVELLCREAPRAIDDLLRYGARLACDSDGRLLQRFFGAHRYRRTCFAGDYTGLAVIQALLAEVDRRGIEILERLYVSDLLTIDGRVHGAVGHWLDREASAAFEAGAVVLATGGHIHVYRRSSSRQRENTGDGMALALRAGAELADMELVQFHPTGWVWPESVEGTLVTEAVRGEGGRLYNALGERFMVRFDPLRLELSTRDRVALANYSEIVAGRGTEHGGVWLDISHVPSATIHERLPRMAELARRYAGIDITREPMEVAPTGHYSMGGVRVDPSTHGTGIPGLFAAGEVAAGVHGANRLGGNSLVECVVFGRRAGEAAGAYALANARIAPDAGQVAERLAHAEARARLDPTNTLRFIGRLQHTMWLKAGMIRHADGLRQALSDIEHMRGEWHSMPPTGAASREALAAALDLDSMLLTAEATVRSALLRSESRGAHQRADFPETDPVWQRTIAVCLLNARLNLSTHSLATPSAEVTAALRDIGELEPAGRLLE